MILDLTEDEKHALAALLKPTIEDDHYPLSDGFAPSKAIAARPLPTILASRPSHLEQTTFSRQSSASVSAPGLSASHHEVPMFQRHALRRVTPY